MASPTIVEIISLLTFLGGVVGLWVRMSVNNAKLESELSAHKEQITELKKEQVRDREKHAESLLMLSDKIDRMPQRILDLMNSVNKTAGNQ